MWKSLRQFWFDIEDIIINTDFRVLIALFFIIPVYILIKVIKLH